MTVTSIFLVIPSWFLGTFLGILLGQLAWGPPRPPNTPFLRHVAETACKILAVVRSILLG